MNRRALTVTWTAESLLELERQSIRAFVESCAGHFTGRTLDYGCGHSPYRDVVTGDYVGHDRSEYPANVSGDDVGPDYADLGTFDAILSTQTIQYHPEPYELLLDFRALLNDGGVLVLTGPTCWPEREPEDLFRFTQAGIELMLREAAFDIVELVPRAGVSLAPGFEISFGWGAVGRA